MLNVVRARLRHYGGGRAPRRAAPGLILLVVLLSCFAWAARAGAARQAAPAVVSDMLVVKGADGASAIYVADEESGKIWWRAAPGDELYPLDLGSFKELEVGGLVKPTGLAYHEGQLLVCDAAASALLSVDLSAGKTSVLLKGDPLKEPTRVAVSPKGVAAIGSSHTEKIILFELATRKTTTLKEGKAANEPERLLYAGGQLVVLNERGKLYSIAPAAPNAETRLAVDDHVAGHVEMISDFALAGASPDSLFVVYRKGLALLSMSRGAQAGGGYDSLIVPIHSGPAESVSPRVIASEGDDLYVADDLNRKVWKYRHVIARLEGNMQQSNEALVSLYGALDEGKILPTLQVVSQERQNSLQEFLLQQNVLIGLAPNTPPARAAGPTNAVTSSALTRMGKLVCHLNGWSCDFSDESNSMKWKAIGRNQQVWLPFVPYSTFRWTSPVELNGKSVAEHLDERIPYKEQREKITAEYLLRLNTPLRDTLEYRAAAEQLILASPSEASFGPGSLIRVENGREVAGACPDNWALETYQRDLGVKPSAWQREMRIAGGAEYLPRRQGQPLAAAELAKLGVARVGVRFEGPVELRALPASLRTQTPQCWDGLANPRHYVVVEAVRVAKGTYELRDKDGERVRLDESLVSRLGLMGSANAEGQLVVEGPYVVAYRPTLWGGPSTFRAADPPPASSPSPTPAQGAEQVSMAPARDALAPVALVSDPSAIKPGGSQDVFGLKSGKFTLPILRWRLDLLADAGLLADPQSVLRKTERDFKGVFILPAAAPQAQAAAQSLALPSQTPTPTPTPEKFIVEENRGTLKKTIDYPAPEILKTMKDIRKLAGVRIGIVEKSGSVDDRNPDFIADKDTNESAWLTVTADDTYVRLVVLPGEPKGIKKVFKSEDEHGTHVAGIIAANTFSWVPGLASSVELMLVDVTNVSELEDKIQHAIDQGVYIFNMSQSIAGNDSNSTLMTNMEQRWGDRLFIAAAGNKSLNFYDFPANESPIKYRLRNLIGVAAADRDGRILEPFVEDGQNFPGTNYGEFYVQLLAPGRAVYSTARDKQYVSLSGSSQAAPQVTAAAAMILAQGVTKEPAGIKARLIYTSDWSDSYLDKVWGGLLDFKRAVWEPRRSLFYTSETDPEEILAIDVITNDAKLTVSNPSTAFINEPHKRGTADRVPDKVIPFRQILRIQSTGQQRYRVIYFDNATNKLRIIMNAELRGEIEYKAHEVWDKESRTFKEVVPPQKLRLPASSIYDYVARADKTPDRIQF